MNKIFSTLLLLIIYSVSSCNSGETKQIPKVDKNELVDSGAKDSNSNKIFQTDWTALT